MRNSQSSSAGRSGSMLACFLTLVFCRIPIPILQAGETVRVEITRDTWLSNYPTEISGSNGAAPRLKLKSIQELSIVDFDTQPLRERTIVRAKLLLKIAGDPGLERVTLSSITCDWVEGTGTSYERIEGASSFSHQIYPKQRWHDSDLTAVCLGNGGSIYASIDAKPATEPGWVELEVPVELLQARLAGLSYGIVLMDDTGSTWKRDGESFQRQLFPNRFVYSRDSNRQSAPYLLVEVEERELDTTPESNTPEISQLRFLPREPQDPRPRLSWSISPSEPDRILGFIVRCDGIRVPQYHVPAIENSRSGRWVMPIDGIDQDAKDGTSRTFEIVTVDRDGRAGTPQSIVVPVDVPVVIAPHLARELESVPNNAGELDWSTALEGFGRYWTVVDPLDTIVPTSRRLIPEQSVEYLAKNHLWNASKQRVTLDSPRGGWIGFQLASSLATETVDCQWVVDDRLAAFEGLRMELHRYTLVNKGSEGVPDPLIAIAQGTTSLSATLDQDPSHRGESQSWLLEMYVPHEVPEGRYRNELVLRSGAQQVVLSVDLQVHAATLPKELSFLPEMNCYDLPENDRDYYQLAHRHRVVLNRLPYYQNGILAKDCCPVWRDGILDWGPFDAKYGDLLSGAAFADSVRGPIPLECLYMAMHENWPSPMESNYNGSYWADQAFPDTYRRAWVSAVAQSVEHARDMGWTDTRFHIFLNNKVDFKDRGWSRGSSPWLLDEPANFQDYWALRYFGIAFHEAKLRSNPRNPKPLPQFMYRCDISRPQWQRDSLDGLMDYAVIAQGAFREYQRLVLDRKFRDGGMVVLYGSNNPIGTNNVMPVAWCWDAWCLGADGVLPWQTIGQVASWDQADELALFYPNPKDPNTAPSPSIRLKAYCYGQQDAELLRLLVQHLGVDRYALGQQLQKELNWHPTDRAGGTGNEPAGWSDYSRQTPEQLHRWRVDWLNRLDTPLVASPTGSK